MTVGPKHTMQLVTFLIAETISMATEKWGLSLDAAEADMAEIQERAARRYDAWAREHVQIPPGLSFLKEEPSPGEVQVQEEVEGALRGKELDQIVDQMGINFTHPMGQLLAWLVNDHLQIKGRVARLETIQRPEPYNPEGE